MEAHPKQFEEPPQWTAQDSAALYMIDRWGAGYFDVNANGDMTVAPLVRVVERARRLLASGYEREALLQALETELEDRREEVAFLYGAGGGPAPLERRVRRAVYFALVIAVASGALAFLVTYPAILGVFATFGAACGTAVAGAIVARELGTRRTDSRETRRLAFWRGWGGKLLFRLARRQR